MLSHWPKLKQFSHPNSTLECIQNIWMNIHYFPINNTTWNSIICFMCILIQIELIIHIQSSSPTLTKFHIKGTILSRSTGHGIGVLVSDNPLTENNTPHDKVILPLLLHKWAGNFQPFVHLKLGHRFHALLKVCSDHDDCPFNFKRTFQHIYKSLKCVLMLWSKFTALIN